MRKVIKINGEVVLDINAKAGGDSIVKNNGCYYITYSGVNPPMEIPLRKRDKLTIEYVGEW